MDRPGTRRQASDGTDNGPAQPTVRIGLALSSGGAAGMAHVGVLEELVAAGIPIHCVAGTSAGAMVGAAYAAGQLSAFRDAMCGLTRRGVLRLFDPVWPHSGLLEGRRPLELIRPYVGTTIEALPLPYAAVATDLRSGNEIVLRRGSVIEAIRASAAVPGLLTPEHLDGRLLVDGGLVDPLPVDLARQLGAQFVIAVSVMDVRGDALPVRNSGPGSFATQLLSRFLAGFDHEEPERPVDTSAADADDDMRLVDVISRSTSLVQARIVASRLKEDPPDFLVAVSLPDIGLFDFHRSTEAVETGRAAARRALPKLQSSLEASRPIPSRVIRWLGRARGRLRGK